jgi:hypothetical protein
MFNQALYTFTFKTEEIILQLMILLGTVERNAEVLVDNEGEEAFRKGKHGWQGRSSLETELLCVKVARFVRDEVSQTETYQLIF